ncbi:hypothetical protein BS78_08G027600 [Paspalum vaginatum]|nr:hypothetical protein BS78_08G027600 [Paspalum vaginatum]
MAIPVARVHLATAHAALPALLPTPPKSSMLPRLSPPCVLILPMPPPKPGSRADAAAALKSSTKSSPPSKPGRADAAERWDAHKIKPSGPASPCSSQRSSLDSSSIERWDAKKKSSSGSNSSASRASSAARWDSTKRAINGSSSAERWDAHKKPCPKQSTGKSDDMVLGMLQRAFYSGQGFAASPEPCMLPMPSFIVRVA